MIIGLVGPKGVGKSTLAMQLFADGSTPSWHRVAFALPIKQMLRQLLSFEGASANVINAMLDGDAKEDPSGFLNRRTARWAMQTLGTEWGRRLIHEDLWIDAWKAHILSHRLKNVLAEDVRFLNEADAVHDLGGKIIAIYREGFGPGDHPSEQEYLQIKADLEVLNTQDSPTDMYEVVKQHILAWKGP